MSVIRILDRTGDTATEWDIDDEASVMEARQKFDEIVSKGYTAFRVDSPSTGEHIRSFDPAAQEIIATAPLVGG